MGLISRHGFLLASLALSAAAAGSPFSTPPRAFKAEKWTDEQKARISVMAERTAVALQEQDHLFLRQCFDADRFITELLSGLGASAVISTRYRQDFRKYLLGSVLKPLEWLHPIDHSSEGKQ
jgi:hypothetical protein